jgi:Dipeptidyl aminopeptidases/acylaminoacyl-peptidases
VKAFDTNEIGPLRDLFAADGYLVFEPNYRGSDNLGNAHEHAIYRDPGNGPDSDVISGIRMVEKQGIVDESRIAAVGHSYGGYMTGWLISHQHFWRCAVVADGAVDWTEEYELSAAGNLAWTRDSLGGSPWDKGSAALYRNGSTHYLCRSDHHADADPLGHRRHHRADYRIVRALPRACQPARTGEVHRHPRRAPFTPGSGAPRAVLPSHQ